MTYALLIIDVQNDFLPGGALAVDQGDQVIPVINELLQLPFSAILATKDWHPAKHISFASAHKRRIGEQIEHQILWPDHCIQDSLGAEFPSSLDTRKIEKTFFKGTKNRDSYSGFFDEGGESTGLYEFLVEQRLSQLVVVGLATDYCVLHSVIDALKLGLQVILIPEGCRAVNLHPKDERKAFEEMKKSGASFESLTSFRKILYGSSHKDPKNSINLE